MLQAFRFEVDPNNHTRSAIASHAGAARFAENWALALVKSRHGRTPGGASGWGLGRASRPSRGVTPRAPAASPPGRWVSLIPVTSAFPPSAPSARRSRRTRSRTSSTPVAPAFSRPRSPRWRAAGTSHSGVRSPASWDHPSVPETWSAWTCGFVGPGGALHGRDRPQPEGPGSQGPGPGHWPATNAGLPARRPGPVEGGHNTGHRLEGQPAPGSPAAPEQAATHHPLGAMPGSGKKWRMDTCVKTRPGQRRGSSSSADGSPPAGRRPPVQDKTSL